MFQSVRIALVATAAAVILAGCGGGNSGNDPAPVAADPAGSNQLVSSIASFRSYTSLALVSPTSQQVAAWNKPKNAVDYLQKLGREVMLAVTSVIPSAVAQAASSSASASASSSSTTTTTTCNVKTLMALDANGAEQELSLTGSTDECVGVTDMFDGKNYVLLAAEGIYSDSKVCNLVFVQKSTGSLFCVGENQRSRYSFTRKDGNNWKKYDILQATENGNYIFLEAKVDLFSDSGDKTGELIKIIRFDLTDSTNGPVAQTVLEGENTAWFNWGNSGDTSYFTIYGYSGLENGDLAVSYQISLYNNTFSQWAYNSRSNYYRYNASTAEFDSYDVNLGSLGGGAGNWWESIKCFLKSGNSGFNFVTFANGTYSLIRGDFSNGAVQLTNVGSTQLCVSWGPSSIVKAGSKYYGIQQAPSSNWTWDSATSRYTGSISFVVFSRDVSAAADVTKATVSVTDRGWATPALYVSADEATAFVAMGAYEEWRWNPTASTSERKQFGAEIMKVNMGDGTNSRVVRSSDNIWISAISNIGSDGSLQFSGRNLSTPLYAKIDGTIDAAGVLTTAPSSAAAARQTFSVVRL